MRTTLTLDDDVAALLKQLQRSRSARPRDLINAALRLGLRQMTSPPSRRKKFRTRAVNLGRCLVANLDCTHEALVIAECEDYK